MSFYSESKANGHKTNNTGDNRLANCKDPQEAIIKLVEISGLSISQFAIEAGIDVSTFYKIYKGQRKLTQIHTLAEIRRFVNISDEELISFLELY